MKIAIVASNNGLGHIRRAALLANKLTKKFKITILCSVDKIKKFKLDKAIKIINSKKLGLVVITKKNYVVGILVDGQVRRGIKNYSKNEKVSKFMTTKPIFINESALASKALALMNNKKITSLLVKGDKESKKKNLVKLKGIIHIHELLRYGIK